MLCIFDYKIHFAPVGSTITQNTFLYLLFFKNNLIVKYQLVSPLKTLQWAWVITDLILDMLHV